MAEEKSTAAAENEFVNFFVYGRQRNQYKEVHLAGEWDRESAEKRAEEFRNAGWQDVIVKAVRTIEGRPLRCRMMLAPDGRWEMTFLESDLMEIKEAMDYAARTHNCVPICPYWRKQHDRIYNVRCECGRMEKACGYCLQAGRVTECLACIRGVPTPKTKSLERRKRNRKR